MSDELIYVGFSQHDCECIYKCPHCGKLYYSWALWREGIKEGDVFQCECKAQIKYK